MSHPNRHVNHHYIDATSKPEAIHRVKEVRDEMKWKSYHSRQKRVYIWVLKRSCSGGHPKYVESNNEDIMLT